MKNKSVVEPKLGERTQEQAIVQPQVTDVASVSNENTPQESQIREVAFQLYEKRGREDGHDLEDWLQAEAIVRSQSKPAA